MAAPAMPLFIWTPRTGGGTNYSIEDVGGVTMAEKLAVYQPDGYDGLAAVVADPTEQATLEPALAAVEAKFPRHVQRIDDLEYVSAVDAIVLGARMAVRYRRGVVICYDGMWIGSPTDDYTASSGAPPVPRFRRQVSQDYSDVTNDQIYYVPYSRCAIASIMRALKTFDGTLPGFYYAIGLERADAKWEDVGRQTPAPGYGDNPTPDTFVQNTINPVSKATITAL